MTKEYNFSVEILENILLYINDPRDISNCRKSCFLFNSLLSNRTHTIKENKRKYNDIIDEYWPLLQRNSSLTMKFILSFKRLKILEFPVRVNNFSDLSVIGMLKHLRKITIRMHESIDPDLLMNFIDNYKNGYVLNNGMPIKQYRSLEDFVFKIIRKKTIRYLTHEKYALIYLDHRKPISLLDVQLLKMVSTKTFITNCTNEYNFNDLNINTVIFASCISDIHHTDYVPWLRVKNYKFQPIKSKYRNESLNILKYPVLNEIRPLVNTYSMPINETDLQYLIKTYINVKNIGVYITNKECINFILSFCNNYNMKNINIYSHFDSLDFKLFPNVTQYNLNNLPTIEEYTDSIFF